MQLSTAFQSVLGYSIDSPAITSYAHKSTSDRLANW